VLDYQRAYPEPRGELSVLRVIAEGQEATAEISVSGGREGDYRMRKLVAGDVSTRLLDPPQEVVRGLEAVALRGYEAEHRHLVVGEVPERLKGA
jgi:hypothetical protein